MKIDQTYKLNGLSTQETRFLEGLIETWMPLLNNGMNRVGKISEREKEEFLKRIDSFFGSVWNKHS